MRTHWTLLAVLLAALIAPALRSDEKLAGIACRSVHLGYPAAEGVAFCNEMTVEKSAEATYFMACGFRMGYFGIQELANGKKVVLFSVWDPTSGNDSKKVKPEQRVKLLHKAPDVRIGRFGGEGTGGQSFFDYEWKPGQTYRFLVTARPEGERTAYAGYFWLPDKKEWKHLVTFSTLAKGKALSGYYSFVEDFRRNRISTTKVRKARFGNGWVKTRDGQWVALTRARFTADSNPATNIDAGTDGDCFYLTTGGDTRSTGTPLGKTMDRPPTGLLLPDMK
jgi:hypothetical protein